MRPYTGELAGVAFKDGVPVDDEVAPSEATVQAILAYAKRHHLVVTDDGLMVLEDGEPEPADPRFIGTKGDGIEPSGTRLRDAAVDPRPADFLPPTNAGRANPHGPLVVAPEIHGTSSRAVTPGPVEKPAAQEVTETVEAVEARADGDQGSELVLERPADSANKPEWVTYAVANGADAETADALTKAELIDQYGGDT